jgi:threonine/homoserine/homoserine lactone efflux protein
MQIRTVAAIMVWFVVALLLLNMVFKSEWILPISITLTVIAVLIYFSPRLRKTKKSTNREENPPPSNPSRMHRAFLNISMLGCTFLQ